MVGLEKVVPEQKEKGGKNVEQEEFCLSGCRVAYNGDDVLFMCQAWWR